MKYKLKQFIYLCITKLNNIDNDFWDDLFLIDVEECDSLESTI